MGTRLRSLRGGEDRVTAVGSDAALVQQRQHYTSGEQPPGNRVQDTVELEGGKAGVAGAQAQFR